MKPRLFFTYNTDIGRTGNVTRMLEAIFAHPTAELVAVSQSSGCVYDYSGANPRNGEVPAFSYHEWAVVYRAEEPIYIEELT